MENLDYSAMANLELIQRYVFFCMQREDAAADRGAPSSNPRFVSVTREMCKAECEILRRMSTGHPES